MNTPALTTAIRQLQAAQSVAVITGAGISAESGIPTFRGAGGLWKDFNVADLATPEAFARNPERVWEWYAWRRREYGQAQPNPAHLTIAAMERFYPRFLVITQNVDTLHAKAGSLKLLEIHGNIEQARCTKCAAVFDHPAALPPDGLVWCPACGALARPHIVWFGEQYDPALMDQALTFLTSTEVVIVVGTSGMVTTPVYLTLQAIENGAYALDINPEASEVSAYVHLHLREKAGIALPQLWQAVTATARDCRSL